MTPSSFSSLSGKRWRMVALAERDVLAMQQKTGLPEVLCRLLLHRGVTWEAAEDYLAPSLKNLLPDPFHLKGMEAAVTRLIAAVEAGETIGVFGDYDVDGATSSALLLHYFRWIGAKAVVHIPDRQKEGYGPNLYGFGQLRAKGARLIITVDTGTLAHSVLAQAAAEGYEVIVVDHHLGEPQLPDAVAVVNPNRFDEDSEYGMLAAVGVVFLLLVGLQQRLREKGFFVSATEQGDARSVGFGAAAPTEKNHLSHRERSASPKSPLGEQGEGGNKKQLPSPDSLHSSTSPGGRGVKQPDLRWLLDIVALGTVADVVPLTGLNRAFVTQGLKVMRQRQNPGLAALLDVAGLDEPPGVYHLGFLLGPRINAGGRVGESDMGVTLLTAADYDTAKPLAAQLNHFNDERKAIEAQVLEAATIQAEKQANQPVIMVGSEGWHEGVIGIVAGRLKEQFNRPAAVLSWNETGKGKASARSVSGVDLGQAIIAARQQNLLLAGGGHAMAAGFTVAQEQFDAFRAFLEAALAPAVSRYQEEYTSEIEGTVPVSALTLELTELLERAGPYGAGNPTPRLLLPEVKILQADVLKEKHLRLTVGDSSGGNARVKVMGFGMALTPLGQELLHHRTRRFHLIGKLKAESWQGRKSVSFMLEDAAFS